MLYEINPITGVIINTHLGNPFTNRLNIPRITHSQPLNSCLNACTRPDILQAIDPFGKMVGFTNFNHSLNVAYKLHLINKIIMGNNA